MAAGASVDGVDVVRRGRGDWRRGPARIPAAGVLVHALWVPIRAAGADRASPGRDGCRGGSCWKTSTSPGRSITRQEIARLADQGDLVRPLVGGARGHAHSTEVLARPKCGGRWVPTPAVLPAVPRRDTFATAGRSASLSLDTEITRQVLGEVPAAFHAGAQDILLIAFGTGVGGVLGPATPIGIDVGGHGRDEEIAGDDVDLSRTVGWFTTKYPIALSLGRSPGTGAKW